MLLLTTWKEKLNMRLKENNKPLSNSPYALRHTPHALRSPFLIGLTGNIAVGKSTVAEFLRQKTATIIDVDKLGHKILYKSEIKEKLITTFGKDILIENEIARNKLANIVFSNKQNLAILNKIVHPHLLKLIDYEIKRHSNEKIIVMDSALIIEWNLQTKLDYLIVVTCSPEKQLQRLVKYKSLSVQEAKHRISAQMNQQKKINLADFVITNNDSKHALQKQVDKLYIKLIEFCHLNKE